MRVAVGADEAVSLDDHDIVFRKGETVEVHKVRWSWRVPGISFRVASEEPEPAMA